MGRITKRALLGMMKLFIAVTVVVIGGCTDNPVDLVKAATVEVMKAHNRYLQIVSVSPAAEATGVNPGASIRIVFDRDLNVSLVSQTTVQILKKGTSGNESVAWSSTFDPKVYALTIRPTDLLTESSQYVVSIKGLKGTDGSTLLAEVSWQFSTGLAPAGKVKVLSGNPESAPGFTNTPSIQVKIETPNSLAKQFTVAYSETALSNPEQGAGGWTWKGIHETWDGTLPSPEEGIQYVYVLLRNDTNPPQYSSILTGEIVYDSIPPAAPGVNGVSLTNNRKPTWSWTSGGGGNGQYRYQLNSTTGNWTPTTATSYTPNSDLADGSYTLYVQERDAAGNWSASGSRTTVVDATPPNSPIISGTTPTTNPRPTWSWTSGGGGNGQYRYQFNSTTGSWTETTATSYTPPSNLLDGSYTLYVQERDVAGNWSASGSKTIVVDIPAPNPP
ncbi:MAG: Ig-like domain-containing protein, partial [Treponemataceae bacterium]|nr:Ig-like domain-containing protein [Treponemataceae bacterium]